MKSCDGSLSVVPVTTMYMVHDLQGFVCFQPGSAW